MFNKLMHKVKTAVFIGYNNLTTQQYHIYASDFKYIIQCGVVTFNETIKESTLNLQICIAVAKVDLQPMSKDETQGILNTIPAKKP